MRQNPKDVENLCEHLKNEKFDSLIEIGVLEGGSAIALSSLLIPGSAIILIDPLERGIEVKQKFEKSVKWLEFQGFVVFVIIGKSTSSFVQKRVRSLRECFNKTLLHIDGDHHRDVVISDFKNFSNGSAKTMFHDVMKNPGVHPAWTEISRDKKHKVFHNNGSSGIGLLE